MRYGLFLIGPAALILCTGPAAGAELPPKQVEFFETKIRPVLVKHCYACHSEEADELKGGLRLDTRGGIRQGGQSGPAVVPGDAETSRLLAALQYQGPKMPPAGQLPQSIIADFVTWVKRGAPDPRDGDDSGQAKTSAKFWAFQTPEQPWIPTVARAGWPATDVDRFVLNRLEAEGLQPVDDADRRSLIRRAYFDLIGLPPTPEEVEAFRNDPASTPKAFAKVVDRLLASPHFGERWGRHWLDVARYAESTGKEWNWAHPEAWRYRDYVVESFNEDKPYDQFIREQIAGDQLPAETWKQRDEQIVATGFLAIGPKSVSLGNDEQFRLQLADEQINTVSRSVLGLTVGCARCHDHKFDPVPSEDYYALAGIFLSTQPLFGTASAGYKGRNNNQPAPLVPIGPEAEQRHQAAQKHQQRVDELTKKLAKGRDELKQLRKKPKKDSDEKHKDRIEALGREIKGLERELNDLKENPPPEPEYAMGVRDRKDPGDTQLRLRGEFNQRGELVSRERFLTAVRLTDPPKIEKHHSGRKALAEWLTHSDNPLTARVMVNRIWQHLFGRGIVPTVDNFGRLGQPPSHPELLDHLAIEFMEDGWSIQRMIRRIMLSRVYRLSTTYDQRNAAADPDNVLLWRMTPRRLQAEVIRDAILAISGQLDPKPLQGSPAVAGLGVGWIGKEIKEPEFKNYDHRHRSVYLPILRDQVPQALQTFDYPNPAEVTGQRDVTIVPAQSLYLMNNEFVIEQSGHAARRVLSRESLSPEERVDLVYRLVLSRPPSAEERQRMLTAVREISHILQQNDRPLKAARRGAWAASFQALFGSGEFLFLVDRSANDS